MNSQYLILAENITFKNNKLTCINIIDRFVTVVLPAESHFDLVALCGPGWKEGEYKITIKVQLDDGDIHEVGANTIKIPNEDFVYNAIAPNMKIALREKNQYVKFYIYRDEELVMQRNYRIAAMFTPQQEEQGEKQEAV